ncbi:MAG: potassium-transporting ATPase subunit A [Proteobacteria bacterium]|nr:potassium-transporting ATPase subunit A [Pseudomonadota bacterium]
MTVLSLPVTGWITVGVFLFVLTLVVKRIGIYMGKVYNGEATFLSPLLQPIETAIYKSCGTRPDCEMDWVLYAKSTVTFSLCCVAVLFSLLVAQGYPEISLDLAFNIAISFSSNSGWQSYVPETTLTLWTQTAGIAAHNLFSAAITLAVMAAFIRGFSRHQCKTIGNFWIDLTRSILYILLPLCFVLSVLLVAEGVIQTFSSYFTFQTLEDGTPQTIAAGPVASFVAVKLLTASGGGYFLANAAHPFENPSALSNLLQMICLILIQVSTGYCFGYMTREPKMGRSLFISMLIIFLPLFFICAISEQAGNPLLAPFGVEQTLGNLEGKELRFGSMASTLWTALTTATSNGATNSAIDSYMPLSVAVPFMFLHFGEVVFGGVGSGLYCMMIYVIFTIFFANLMVGRSPVILGKKLDIHEIKMSCLFILTPALLSLIGAAIAVMVPAGQAAVGNPAEQGFNEILYAFASTSNTNGSAMAGLQSNTPFFNIGLGLCMLLVRFSLILIALSISGSMAQKIKGRNSAAAIDTSSNTFIILLVGVVFLIDILAFVPSLALGPIAAHLHLSGGG